MQKPLIVYASQASWAIPCRTHAHAVMLKVPLFVSKAKHFHLISLSVCFYWESLSIRWVLSNTLMNTICSQYFADRQHHAVDFHLIVGIGPWTVPTKRLEPVQVAGTCPTNLDPFDFVGLVVWSKFAPRLFDFFFKAGHPTRRAWSSWLVAGTSLLVCRPYEITSHVNLPKASKGQMEV